MTTAQSTHSAHASRELILSLTLAAPRTHVWRCWTEPELLKQWFCPLPWTTPFAELDVRTGGTNRITMRSPDGEDMPTCGVYLEVVPLEKIVVTDAYTSAWEPSEKPFMTAVITFEDGGPQATKYTARALHWSVADREEHEKWVSTRAGRCVHVSWKLSRNRSEAPWPVVAEMLPR